MRASIYTLTAEWFMIMFVLQIDLLPAIIKIKFVDANLWVSAYSMNDGSFANNVSE